MKTTSKHTRSSSDLRPSRKFLTMVNMARDRDRTSHNVSLDSERNVLQCIVNKADELEMRGRLGMAMRQDLRENRDNRHNGDKDNHSFDEVGMGVGTGDKITPEIPRSGRTSPDKDRSFCFDLQHSLQYGDRIKKLAMYKRPELDKLENLIGRALEDLNTQSLTRPKKSPLRKNMASHKKPKPKTSKDNVQVKVASVLILLVGIILIFFVM